MIQRQTPIFCYNVNFCDTGVHVIRITNNSQVIVNSMNSMFIKKLNFSGLIQYLICYFSNTIFLLIYDLYSFKKCTSSFPKSLTFAFSIYTIQIEIVLKLYEENVLYHISEIAFAIQHEHKSFFFFSCINIQILMIGLQIIFFLFVFLFI